MNIVIGRWLRDLPSKPQGTYDAMLDTAHAHRNYRFWLLDLRCPPVAGPDLNTWSRDQFSPRLAAVFNGLLFNLCTKLLTKATCIRPR